MRFEPMVQIGKIIDEILGGRFERRGDGHAPGPGRGKEDRHAYDNREEDEGRPESSYRNIVTPVFWIQGADDCSHQGGGYGSGPGVVRGGSHTLAGCVVNMPSYQRGEKDHTAYQ